MGGVPSVAFPKLHFDILVEFTPVLNNLLFLHRHVQCIRFIKCKGDL